MKKLFIVAMAACAVFASCSKNETTAMPVETSDGSEVLITLATDNQTRAFFDDTAAAEDWEKEITTLSVYAFDAQGRNILRRNLTTPELTAKSTRFTLPNSSAGTACSFYVVANADYGAVTTTTAFDSRTETVTLDQYNGSANEVVMGRKRSEGFVMTGKITANIAAQGNTTNVSVSLKRLVAKVAVKSRMSDDFSSNFNGGVVIITNATISRANAMSYSFPRTSYTKSTLYSHSQESNAVDGYFGNMFFIYGNTAQGTDANKVLLTLDGFFDADGQESTTTDRSEVRYQVLLDGAGNGEIKANGYYRIEAVIKGLSGDGVIVSFTVADWETPVTQTVDLGI